MSIIEERNKRKESERLAIAEKLVPQKKKWYSFKPVPHYTTTWQVANEPPYFQQDIQSFHVYYPKYSGLVAGLVVIAVCAFIYFMSRSKGDITPIAFLLIVMIFFSYSIAKEIKNNRNRLPQLTINGSGIYLASEDVHIGWYDLLETYIKITDKSSEDESRYLVLYYLNNQDAVADIELSLDRYKVDYRELAYAIEYIKQQST